MVSVVIPAGTRALDLGSSGHPLTWYHTVVDQGIGAVFLDGATAGITADIANALAAGLTVSLFQGYYVAAWAIPAEATTRAQQLVDLAHTVGIPAHAEPPVVLWLDLEACGAVPAAAIFTWVTAWGRTVQAAGYAAGVYVGAAQPLTSQQLYALPTITHYWRAASTVPPVAVRGYQVLQETGNQPLADVLVDTDTIQTDALGGLPVGVALTAGPTGAMLAQLQQQVHHLQTAVSALQTEHTQTQHTLTTTTHTVHQLQRLADTIKQLLKEASL
jgi:hypothetical protein